MLSGTETQLREQIDRLVEERDYWRDQVRGRTDDERRLKLQRAFGLTPVTAAILAAMYDLRGRPLTNALLEDERWAPNQHADAERNTVGKTQICKLRKRIGSDAIMTVWGTGYAITEKGIAICDAALQGRVN